MRRVDKRFKPNGHIRTLINREKRGKGCVDCGKKGRKHLTFHHKDPTEKKFTIGSSDYDYRNPIDVLLEMDKCILLCNDCHKERHR